MLFQGGLPDPEDVGPLTTNDAANQLSAVTGSAHDFLDGHAFADEARDNGVCLFTPETSLVLGPRSGSQTTRTCRIDLRTASRKAWLAFSIKCQLTRKRH